MSEELSLEEKMRGHPDYNKNLKLAKQIVANTDSDATYRANVNKENFILWIFYECPVTKNMYHTPIVINQDHATFYSAAKGAIADARRHIQGHQG